ncbi:MAG: type II secretion system F family protein, partial [bacterium]
MATFTCRIATAGGRVLVEDRQAASADRARRQLEAEGYYVFHVLPHTSRSPFRISLPAAWRRVQKKDLLILNQELLALIKAGLPILSALDLVMARQTHPRLRQVLEKLREAVKGGASLSDAAEQHPDVFSPLYVASLRVGEKSGELPEALARYIVHLKRVIVLQKKLGSALLYP